MIKLLDLIPEKANQQRLSSAQTFLIPGLGEDVGFQVHFLYYYQNVYLGTRNESLQINTI